MPQRAAFRARRRSLTALRAFDWTMDPGAWNAAHVSPEWDVSTYDDVIPHRLRGTVIVDDNGEPAELTDLVADRRMI